MTCLIFLVARYLKLFWIFAELYTIFFFLSALQPNVGYDLLTHEVFLDHSQPTQHSR